jgi:histidinol-phosphate phosphatase family protein
MAFIKQYAQCASANLSDLPWEQIGRVVDALHDARWRRAAIYVCGNGGSAATASHMVNDLNKGANAQGAPRFRAHALVDNLPLLTAWSNDACYADALAEQLRNLARPGDVLVSFSGSGNSPNVLNAVALAAELGLTTIGFCGASGGKLAQIVDLAVLAPSGCMEQIEDLHMLLEHAIVSALRDRAQGELIPIMILANGYGAAPTQRALTPARPAVFLDRDGVINHNRAEHVKSWAEFELFPWAVSAVVRLASTPAAVVVVSNQAAIGRQQVSYEVVESINRRLMDIVAVQGGRIDAVAWCPHRPDQECECRKPKPGMLRYAADVLGIDLARSYMVGDAEGDMAAAVAVGCKPVLVLTGRGGRHRAQVEACWHDRCAVVEDLGAAVQWILADSQGFGCCDRR